MKLWSGFFTWRVEWLFGIDESTGSRIFVSWVNFIYLCLSAIPIWPTREQVDQTMPQTFKDSYPSIHVNIDCSEFYCEAPTPLELKGNMCIQTITVTRPIRPSGNYSPMQVFLLFPTFIMGVYLIERYWKEVVFSTQTCLMMVMK